MGTPLKKAATIGTTATALSAIRGSESQDSRADEDREGFRWRRTTDGTVEDDRRQRLEGVVLDTNRDCYRSFFELRKLGAGG